MASLMSPPAASTLSMKEYKRRESKIFEQHQAMLARDNAEEEGEGDHGGEHHGEREESILTAAAAAVINYLLMFGLCCAFGMIMFSNDFNKKHRAIAVKASLATAMIMGLVAACRSSCKVAIGGTDLNPIVFMGMFAKTISEQIAKDNGLGDQYAEAVGLPSFRCLAKSARSLGEVNQEHGKKVDFCGYGSDFTDQCEAYHQELRATMIFTIAASSALIGFIFFFLGRNELVRYVAYVPTSISDAFLSCVGYKVFKYGLKFCKWQLKQFVPAAILGVLLYFLKANHVGNPAIVMPLGILLPLGMFWVYIYATNSNVEQARQEGLLFPEMPDVHFWEIWTDSVGKYDSINFGAWVKTFPDLLIMIIVCVLDAALKVAAIEGKMPVKVRKNKELRLYGCGNILTTLFGAPIGYQQLKFSVINYGVMGNATDQRGGVIFALLCGATFFTTIAHFNYLPRFFLSMLLFFAGAGFVAENLWGSRKNLSLSEWIEVIVILGVFILTGQLLPAVLTGCLLCGFSFIRKYAGVAVTEGEPLRGDQVVITRRPEDKLAHASVEHILATWLLVVRLKGFVFFASAQSLIDSISKRFNLEDSIPDFPKHKKLKYLILDCRLLDGMDASGKMAMSKLSKECKKREVSLIWSSISKALGEDLHSKDFAFVDLDSALLHVYAKAMAYRQEQQHRWLEQNPAFAVNNHAWHDRIKYDPFGSVFSAIGTRAGVPWAYCSVLPIHRNKTVLFSNDEVGAPLYLVHCGEVGLFAEDPVNKTNNHFKSVEHKDNDETRESRANGRPMADAEQPQAIYTRGWFLNASATSGMPADGFAVALSDGFVIAFTPASLSKMSFERPLMYIDLMRAVVRQQALEQEMSQQQMLVGKDFNWLEFSRNAENAGDAANIGKATAPQGYAVADTASDSGREDFLKSLPLAQARIKELRASQKLFRKHYFANAALQPGHSLPELPMLMSKDLEVAFYTFAEEVQGQPILRGADVERALYYAGFFNGQEGFVPKDMDLHEFTQLGRQRSFHILGVEQVRELRTVFDRHDTDRSQALDRDEMHLALNSLLGVEVDMPSVQSITYAYANGANKANDGIDFESFVNIVSWFVKQCEAKWAVINALHQMFNGREHLTADLLKQASGHRLTEDEAEEMLWAADWRHTAQDEPAEGELDKAQGHWREYWREPSCLDMETCYCAIHAQFWGSSYQKLDSLPLEPTLSLESWRDIGRVGTARAQLQPVSTRRTIHLKRQNEDSDEEHSDSEHSDEVSSTLKKLEQTLEDPQSSDTAFCLNCIFIFFIVLSCVEIMAEPFILNVVSEGEQYEKWKEILFILEIFFTTVFVIELLVRTVVHVMVRRSCWSAFKFLFSPQHALFDVVAILPLFVELALRQANHEEVKILRLFRLVRLSRFARLAKMSSTGCPMMAPVSAVLIVIWTIFLIHEYEHAH